VDVIANTVFRAPIEKFEVGSGPRPRWLSETELFGSGIWPTSIFPAAMQIVDLYHAREHLWKIAAWLHPNDLAAKKL
jgi:hypothetical protein